MKSKRQTLGRYGLKALDVTPGVAWPTESDVEDLKEYERVGYPLSLEESWKLFAETKRVAEEEIRLRYLSFQTSKYYSFLIFHKFL